MREPHLCPYGTAWVADDATIVGDVSLGRDCSVWYGSVVRGDVASITIGARTNIQDLTVVHPQHDEDVVIGDDVVVGHGVKLHCRTVGDRVLIGMGAILLPGARIGNDALVAAGALVPIGMEVPDGMLVRGAPARIIRKVAEEERRMIRETGERYLELIAEHRSENC